MTDQILEQNSATDPQGAEQQEPAINLSELTAEQIAELKKLHGLLDNGDVDNIVKSKHSKWQKELEQQKSEAEKLAKMNAEERMAHELEKKAALIKQYEEKEALHAMNKVARSMFEEKKHMVPDNVLSYIVSSDSDTTKERVEAFIGFLDGLHEQRSIERNTGTTPKRGSKPKELDPFEKKLEEYKKREVN